MLQKPDSYLELHAVGDLVPPIDNDLKSLFVRSQEVAASLGAHAANSGGAT